MFPWEDYLRYRVSSSDPKTISHETVIQQIREFEDKYPQDIHVTHLGDSVEGRSILKVSLGKGARSVFAWSQMHGNEPTHTAALLDLVNFLLSDPQHPSASTILEGCKLDLVLMLNPDGAEKWTRRNAQDIDINRDARHLQTPEGRILHQAIEELQPDYAFNLHNQRPRTTVAKTQQVAAFSLLVPPVDDEASETKNVRQAKQLASYLAVVAGKHAPGPISRYSADYMPRCFGEWVQQQGAATITIEAGGWSTTDLGPLVQLHGYVLIRGLEAIATGYFAESDPSDYDLLPLTGEQDLHDVLIRGVTIENGLGQPSFTGDIGVGFENHVSADKGAQIIDLGDLSETSGKTVIDKAGLVCVPGRIAFHTPLTPSELPDGKAAEFLIANGVTTAIGLCDLEAMDHLECLESLDNEIEFPIHVGFVAQWTKWSEEVRDHLLRAVSLGILGVVAEDLSPQAREYLDWFGIPLLAEGELPAVAPLADSLHECANQSVQLAQKLGLKNRGSICLGNLADLAVYRAASRDAPPELELVMVGGTVVFERGQTSNGRSGEIVKSSL